MPELLEPRRVGGRVLDGVLDVPVSEVILNEPRIRALVGQGEAASVAQHVRMGKQGQGSGGAVLSAKARLTVDRCNGLRCSLTKNVLPVGFIRARSFSHALMALNSSPRSGCVVDSPPFNRATCKHAAFGVHLVEFQSGRPPTRAGRAGTSTATGNGRGPRSGCPCRLDQPFNLAPGEVLAVAVIAARPRPFFLLPGPCRRPVFPLFRRFIILSSVRPFGTPEKPVNRAGGFGSIYKRVSFFRG